MPLPRKPAESDSLFRTAAIDRLRKEHGLVVSVRTDAHVAKLIKTVEPGLSGAPALVIRAWVSAKRESRTPPRTVAVFTPPYQPRKCGQMAAAMERLAGIPKPVALTSNTSGLGWNT